MKTKMFLRDVVWSVLFAATAYVTVFALFLQREVFFDELIIVVEIVALYECLKWFWTECYICNDNVSKAKSLKGQKWEKH